MAAPGRVGYYDALDFNSPLTDASADLLVAEVAATTPATVLDIGCGWAELLLRVLARCPTAAGHGIDRDEVLVERARGNAVTRGLSDRMSFSQTVSSVEPADLVICVGAEHVFGTLDEALPELHALVRPVRRHPPPQLPAAPRGARLRPPHPRPARRVASSASSASSSARASAADRLPVSTRAA